MGESELKAALRREGEGQARRFWQEAEAAVEKRRKETESKQAQLRTEAESQQQAQATTLRNDLLFEAQAQARKYRLHAEAALDERLRVLARQILLELVNHDRATLWQALRNELPEADWTTLKVHSADRGQATQAFPTAAIECDTELGGGLIVANADGSVHVDNSLNCRLSRAWPDLLPKLLTELRQRLDNHETTL